MPFKFILLLLPLSTLLVVRTLCYPATAATETLLESRNAKSSISTFDRSDVHCHNTTLYDDDSALPEDLCVILPAGGNMADPNGNRVGGRWGGLDNITAYRSRDCQETVWSVFKKLEDKEEEGSFCVLLSDLLPGDPEPFYSSVMGTRTMPKTDLSTLNIDDIPPLSHEH